MKYKLTLVLSLFIINQTLSQSITTPSAQQIEWANAEIGVIIHYDINIYAPETFKYEDKNTLPPLSTFNPSKLNTDQWLEAASKAGAKYAVLVAKHGTGFCLWPTKAHPYNISNTPFRNGQGDIVADFIKSCKKFNIKPGFYYNTNFNTYFGAGYIKLTEEERLKYNEIVYKQLSELWSNYGILFEIWFDGGVMVDKKIGIADKVIALLREHQPNAVLFQGPLGARNLLRWVGNEDGRAPYPMWSTSDATTSSDGIVEIPNLVGNPNGQYWIPAESDFPNRKKSSWNGGWLWKTNEDSLVFSTEELIDRYYTSVGRNTNMLIGMVIDTSGLFPIKDFATFENFGKALKKCFEKKVCSVNGKGNTIIQYFDKESDVNQIIIQEDIKYGERVLKYSVEAYINNTWIEICKGESIGHKRIQTFKKIKTSRIRLNIIESKAEPNIINFSSYLNDQIHENK